MSIQAPVRERADADACAGSAPLQGLSEERAVESARVFKALADPVRLQLLSLIGAGADGEVCVCELTDSFDLSAPTISYHLKVLRQAGLIVGERRGTWIYYRLVNDAFDDAASVLTGVPAVGQ